jgi:peptide-methionine (R)-S-oxide reductase
MAGKGNSGGTSRRTFLVSAAALAAGGSLLFNRFARAEGETIVGKPGKVTVETFDDAGKSLGPATVDKVVKTEDAWRAQFKSADERTFEVTRQEGTEGAFTGPYWDNHKPGLYRCICCGNALYTSDTKYDSGTGWPSFWQPIAKSNVVEADDTTFGMVRTKVSCAECDAHLGHVFNDGPQPTGLRYCMDGVALRFIPRPVA